MTTSIFLENRRQPKHVLNENRKQHKLHEFTLNRNIGLKYYESIILANADSVVN